MEGPIRMHGMGRDCVLFFLSLFIDLWMCRWKFRRVLVTDGDFSLEHMRMQRPDLDVGLTDGEGYMVESAPYRQHLEESIEVKEVWQFHFFMTSAISSELTYRNPRNPLAATIRLTMLQVP
jgi:hypothetical protein